MAVAKSIGTERSVTYWRMSFKWGDEDLWPYCRDRGIAATGYYWADTDEPALGDCSKLTRDEIETALSDVANVSGRYALRAVSLRMKPGDVIFARSSAKIVGWGVVKSEYRWRPSVMESAGVGCRWEHCRDVQWTEFPKPFKLNVHPLQFTTFELKDDNLRRMLAAASASNPSFPVAMSPDPPEGRRPEQPKPEVAKNQGFAVPPKARSTVEEHAMRVAIDHLQNEGYSVDRIDGKESYDLCCKRGRKRMLVEVKGTQSDGAEILLTRNEVAFALKTEQRMALAIVSGIRLTPSGKAKGGTLRLIEPWVIVQDHLRAYTFAYRVPPR